MTMNEPTEPIPKTSAEDRMPGDPSRDEIIARMIRVDHAGEYGAVRIYAGQQAVLRNGDTAALVREMAEKEAEHLARFDKIVGDRGVRPTGKSVV